ncbi:hypothetical protein ANCDUO_07665 [Ancylostoma duodenale]|uniref:Uncharacterized protein n=1 Tax=Ancylostoma duodenale TaxID=51022 RepID=A0A0C2GSS8_9BILA|nr:hypothetical protein ANCDUO_07665 [Ancylostoma duodenale]
MQQLSSKVMQNSQFDTYGSVSMTNLKLNPLYVIADCIPVTFSNQGESEVCDVPIASRSQIQGVDGTLIADVTSPHGKNHRIVFYRDINVFAFELLE